MELKVECMFDCKGFSPHWLAALPSLGCLLAADRDGRVRILDLNTGAVLLSSELSNAVSPDKAYPMLCTLHPSTSKIVVVGGRTVGARAVLDGGTLLKTILQEPARKESDDICIEIPVTQVPLLLRQLRVLSSKKPELLKEVVRQLERGLEDGEKGAQSGFPEKGKKWQTVSFHGPSQELSDLFDDIMNRLKPGINKAGLATITSSLPPSPILPVVAAICLRLLLLRPDHDSLVRFERGEDAWRGEGGGVVDSRRMYCEALRKLSLAKWPHKNYVWAVPKTMAAAGFYQVPNPPTHGLNVKGDRVSCFACRVYLYSWDPTDEPWSEHERHAMQCPFMRGDYTENVPLAVTEGSHPARACANEDDYAVCLSTSTNCGLVGVATLAGHITIWDVDRGLFIMEHAKLNINPELLDKCLESGTTQEVESAGREKLEPQANEDLPEIDGAPSTSEENTVVPKLNEDLPEIDGAPSTSEESTIAPKLNEDLPEIDGAPSTSEENTIAPKVNEDLPEIDGAPSTSEENTIAPKVNEDLPEIDGAPSTSEENTIAPKLNEDLPEIDGAPSTSEESIIAPESSDRPAEEPTEDSSETSQVEPTVSEAVKSRKTALAQSKEDESTLELDNVTASHKPIIPMAPDTTHPPTKHSFHITSLALVAAPSEATSAKPSPVAHPALITGVTTATQDGRAVPVLLVHAIRSPDPPQKSKNESSKSKQFPVPTDPILDYFPEFEDQVVPQLPISVLPTIPPPLSNTLADILGDSDEASAHPTLANVHLCCSLPLWDLSHQWHEGPLPEVQQILPLNGGRLIAVNVGCSRLDSSTEEKKFAYSALLLYKVVKDTEGNTTIEPQPANRLNFSSPTDAVVNMCAVEDLFSGHENKESSHGGDLLAVATKRGSVVLYETDHLTPQAEYTTEGEEESYRSCICCARSGYLAVSTQRGDIVLLRVQKAPSERREQTDSLQEESLDKAIPSQPLTSKDLDQFSVFIQTSPKGIPFSGSAPHGWREVSLLQHHRRTPIHMHLQHEELGDTRIWQFQPPADSEKTSQQQLFELTPSQTSAPIGCISIKFGFANPHCLCDEATVSILRPKWERSSMEDGFKPASIAESSDAELLCGPIRLKPLVDVTGRSAQVLLSHPRLMSDVTPVLWLLTEDLFPLDYSELAAASESGEATSIPVPPLRRRTTVIKHGVVYRRRQPVPTRSTASRPEPGTLSVTLHPLATSPNREKLGLFLTLMHSPEFISLVALAACNYVLEEAEYQRLPDVLQRVVGEFHSKESKNTPHTQLQALDLLCWMAAVHCSSAKGEGYPLVTGAVGQLLTSLMLACFIRGERMLAHKCSRMLITLSKNGNSSLVADDFHSSLVHAACSLLPLLPLTSSAASVHWFLRLVAVVVGSHDRHLPSHVCLSLLTDLTEWLSTKTSVNAQLLQTHFKQEGSIFEPELFDIYLSYCQKGSSKPQAKAMSYIVAPPPPLPVVPPYWPPDNYNPSIPPTSIIVHAPPSITPPTASLMVDKKSQTIYDLELQLLLDCSKKTDAQASKAIEDFTTFKHGSFLLYSQRGLLETEPLEYSCISVAGNATVQEPNVQPFASIPEGSPSHTQVVESIKTMGYYFPPPSKSKKEKKFEKYEQESSLNQLIPPPVSDILMFPKELVMHIDALKSGVAYSAILRFPLPVILTDITIPSTMYMSSVSVDVWLKEDGEEESVRVAHSSEIRDKSLMIGNLMPPPLCLYAKVTFVGRLGASREKAQVFLGSFYGRPVLFPDMPFPQVLLHSLEQKLLAQYMASREHLTTSLMAYASTAKQGASREVGALKQWENQVTTCYRNCFRAQVKLARLRNLLVRQQNDGSAKRCVESVIHFNLLEQLVDLSEMSTSQLYKLIGCLVDALLILCNQNGDTNDSNQDSNSEPTLENISVQGSSQQPCTLTEEECSLLFTTLCIHGVPKMHARACALLICLCGSQPWWGRFVTKAAVELFSTPSAVFDKERALLQLSALCQRTYQLSDIVACLFRLVEEKLQSLHEEHTPLPTSSRLADQQLLQWLVLLLSHFLASLSLHRQTDVSQHQSNLFVPLLRVPPSKQEQASSGTEETASEGATSDAEGGEMRQRRDLKRRMMELQLELQQALTIEEKAMLRAECEAIMQELRTQRRQKLLPPTTPPSTALPPPSPDPAISSLPTSLCLSVARGLVHYILMLTATRSWELVPVACKCLSQLVLLHSHKLLLPTLVDQNQLNQLLAFCCQQTHSLVGNRERGSMQWAHRAVSCLIMNVLYHGEATALKAKATDSKPGKEESMSTETEPDSTGETRSEETSGVSTKAEEVGESQEQSVVTTKDEVDAKPEPCPENAGKSETKDLVEDLTPLPEDSDPQSESKLSEAEGETLVTASHSCPEDANSPDDDDTKSSKIQELAEIAQKVEETDMPGKATISANLPGSTEPIKMVFTKQDEMTKALQLITHLVQQQEPSVPLQVEVNVLQPPESKPKPKKKLSKHSLMGKKFAPGDYTDIPVYKPADTGDGNSGPEFHLPYNSFIISGTLDSRLLHTVHLPAELELQNVAKQAYERVLVTLLNAKPCLVQSWNRVEEEEDSMQEHGREPISHSVDMLCTSMEQLLEQALSPQSNIDVVSVLELWNELNSLLEERTAEPTTDQKKAENDLEKQILPDSSGIPICSHHAINLLLDNLFQCTSPSARLWQLGMALLHKAVKQWVTTGTTPAEKNSPINASKFSKMLVKLFLYNSQEMVTSGTQELAVARLLAELTPLRLGGSCICDEDTNMEAWLGVHLLLSTLVTVLEKGGEAALNSPTLLHLINSLGKEEHLKLLWNDTPGLCYQVADMVRRLCHAVVSLLPTVLGSSQQPAVVLYAAEMDEDRRRYRYMSGPNQIEMKWVPIQSEQSSSSYRLISELIQLMRQVLSITVPEAALLPLQEFCGSHFGNQSTEPQRDFLSLADPSMPLLVLVYADSPLLVTLLRLLNSIASTGEEKSSQPSTKGSSISRGFVQSLFCNFVPFLDAHCCDHSCFFQPILEVLGTREVGVQVSKAFMTLLGNLTLKFEKQGRPEQLLNFIHQGGAELIFECLISSCRQSQPFSNHSIVHGITKLRQKDLLHPSKEKSGLTNFLPLAHIQMTPHRTSARDLQSSGLGEPPSRASTFHHTFHSNEEWLKMTILLPYPILLHAIQLYQPMGLVQNGPSAVLVECASQRGLTLPVSVTPLLPTTGLACFKLEFQSTVVTQEVVLHLRRPVIADSISISHLYLMGVGYGSGVKEVEGSLATSVQEGHPSAGWLYILHKWLCFSSDIQHQLMEAATVVKDLLPTCLSLLHHQEALGLQMCNHLRKLLVAMASHSPDHGIAILQHLLGIQAHDDNSVPSGNVASSPHLAVELLHELCETIHPGGSDRLLLAIRLLSHLPHPHLSPSPSLPSLVCALSNVVWDEGCSIDLSEEVFRSLVEAAFSQEVGIPLKSALNALLCAICKWREDLFFLALGSCQQAVQQSKSEVVGKLLHTLAHVAHSSKCTEALLQSELLANVASQLERSFSDLIKQGNETEDTALTVRDQLSVACMNLAFLTDLCRNWVPAKNWLGGLDICKFWPPMVEFLSQDNTAVTAVEISFCQEVACEFLMACISGHHGNKLLFTQLLCNCILGSYSFQKRPLDSDTIATPCLTPFLYRLMVNLVLTTETVPVIVTFQDEKSGSQNSPLLTPTHECPNFHPSFPIGQQFCYLKLPAAFTVEELGKLCTEQLVNVETKMAKKLPPSDPGSTTLDLAKFNLRKWKLSGSKAQPTVEIIKPTIKTAAGAKDSKHPQAMSFVLQPQLGDDPTPAVMLVAVRQPTPDKPTALPDPPTPTLLELFIEHGGLQPLGQCLPALYPYHWPELFTEKGDIPDQMHRFKAHSLFHKPTLLPFHSAVMFVLCLRLHCYDDMIGENLLVTSALLRLILGAELRDPIPKAELEQLLFLPYLVLLQTLREHRPHSEEGVELWTGVWQVGVVHHTLHCLSFNGHHPPRIGRRDTTTAEALPAKSSTQMPTKITTSSDKHYWAKGTGFATGSTASTWNMEAMLARQKLEEKYVSLCFAILAEYLVVEVEEEDATDLPAHCSPELLDIFSASCLLPAMGAYLINDSVLDISKHVELYQSVLDLLSSLASNPALRPLLTQPVFSEGSPDPTSEETTLASLSAKLKQIANTYLRTVRVKILASPLSKQEKQDPNAPPLLPRQPLLPRLFRAPPTTQPSMPDEAGLAELVQKILTTSERVAAAVRKLQAEGGGGEEVGKPQRVMDSSFDAYMRAMKPLQFDTYQFLEEDDETGEVKFKIPFHFEPRVQSGISSAHGAARARRLAQEVTSLATSLPLSPSSSVFVRCDEERLDIMKVLITGPSETPYANGCFEFDVFFPLDYPRAPMSVNLMTTGLGRVRFNPNLYSDGKVCLSVLNTWHGRPEEKWNSQNSSFLQVLVSIQSLILVPEPYFNEPGYEQYRGTPYGDHKSLTYNANIYVANVQWAMINQIRNPTPCFKEVILQHFYLRRGEVLAQCERWKQELAEGIRSMQEAGMTIAHLKEYLRSLVKSVDTLRTELGKIKPSDFQQNSSNDSSEETADS